MNKAMVIIVVLLALLMSCSETYDTGECVGVVTRLSKRGIVWRTWEGTLDMPNPNEPSVKFSFDGQGARQDSLAAVIQKAQKRGCMVKLIYYQTLGCNWFGRRGETSCFVTDVVVVDDEYLLGSNKKPIHVIIDK